MSEDRPGYGSEETMKRTQVYLPVDMVEWLKEKAREHDSSMARIIRDAVGEYRVTREQQEDVPILTDDDPIWNIVGMFSSGVADGAVNHDHYLYGAPKVEP